MAPGKGTEIGYKIKKQGHSQKEVSANNGAETKGFSRRKDGMDSPCMILKGKELQQFESRLTAAFVYHGALSPPLSLLTSPLHSSPRG